MKENLKKNMLWNMVGSLTYVFATMFFAIIVTRINGLDEAGAFGIAFSLANLLLTIGNYATRTFQVTETKSNDRDFAFHRVFTILLMIVITIGYSVINNYSGLKLHVLYLFVFYKALEAISEVLYGIIQKKGELYKVGISLFIKAVGGILIFFIIDTITKNLIYSLIGLLVYTSVVILAFDLNVISKYKLKKYKLSLGNVFKIFKEGFNPFVFSFLGLYVMSASRFAIDGVIDDRYQSIFTILMLPATIIILLSQFMIQPFLTVLKDKMVKRNFKEFKSIIRGICLKVFIMMLILVVCSYFYGESVLGSIYNVDLSGYAKMITMVIIGASFCGIVYVLSAALTTLRITFYQVIIYGVVSLIAYFSSSYLVKDLEMYGSIVSYLITMSSLIILYILLYKKSLKKLR